MELDSLNSILGIAASLIAIGAPLVGYIIAQLKKPDERLPPNSYFEIKNSSNVNIYNINQSAQLQSNSRSNLAKLDSIIIENILNKMKTIKKVLMYALVSSLCFSALYLLLELLILNNSSNSRPAPVLSHAKIDILIYFICLFSISFISLYMITIYFYDRDLRSILDSYGYSKDNRKLNNLLIGLAKLSIPNFTVYPLKTIRRMIINNKNKRNKICFFHDTKNLCIIYIIMLFIVLAHVNQNPNTTTQPVRPTMPHFR